MADYSDAFTGGAENASITGANWASYRDTPGGFDQWIYVAGGESVRPAIDANSLGVRWTGGAVGADQRSKITLASAGVIGSATFYVSVSARCSGATTTAHCYQFTWTPSAWYISRVNNGTGTDLGFSISGAPSVIASGSTMEIVVTASGTTDTITGYYNGTSIGFRTYDHGGGTLASGTPGFEAYNSGAAGYGQIGAWEGGDYPAGGGGGGSTELPPLTMPPMRSMGWRR